MYINLLIKVHFNKNSSFYGKLLTPWFLFALKYSCRLGYSEFTCCHIFVIHCYILETSTTIPLDLRYSRDISDVAITFNSPFSSVDKLIRR